MQQKDITLLIKKIFAEDKGFIGAEVKNNIFYVYVDNCFLRDCVTESFKTMLNAEIICVKRKKNSLTN